ncbi:MAG: recombination protein RecR [Flavobacteriales bacterium]|nr:recombination protein RecR [Flavobacteriales bacterium]|tara:strand:- start:21930 stop:22553 length:624 start_codon:yes stop_codon:yes gene_type:complete
MNEIFSPSFNRAVEQLSSLPGIGRKTATRLVLHLLTRTNEELNSFSTSFSSLASQINYCESCYTITENTQCNICTHPNRSDQTICVVENVLDVYAIENTNQFKGKYHVLGGIISPMEGIGPNDVKLNELFERIRNENTQELILALSATMEGDATNFYIFKKLKDFPIKITTIARGIGIGDELEYTDELTLGRSILNRVPFENTLTLR